MRLAAISRNVNRHAFSFIVYGFSGPMKFLTRIAIIIVLAGGMCGCGAGNSLDALDSGTGNAAGAGNGKLPGHVYLMWGLAGEIFSRGLDGLAAKIEKAGVAASVHSMVEVGAITDTIVRNYKRDPSSAPVMLLGHSSGGDVVIAIAERLKAVNIPVALILGFDPTPIAGRIPANVEMFINLYQATNLIGGASAVPASDFRGRLINVDLREHREIVHITLDKSDVIHALVIDKVVGVAAAAAQKQTLAMAAAPQSGAQAKQKRPPTPLPPSYVLPLTLKYVVPAKEPISLFDSAISITSKPDDTLETIAARTNTPGWAIAQVNKLSDDNPLLPGQRLLIPQIVYSARANTVGNTSAPAGIAAAR